MKYINKKDLELIEKVLLHSETCCKYIQLRVTKHHKCGYSENVFWKELKFDHTTITNYSLIVSYSITFRRIIIYSTNPCFKITSARRSCSLKGDSVIISNKIKDIINFTNRVLLKKK